MMPYWGHLKGCSDALYQAQLVLMKQGNLGKVHLQGTAKPAEDFLVEHTLPPLLCRADAGRWIPQQGILPPCSVGSEEKAVFQSDL